MQGRTAWFSCVIVALVLGACSREDITSPEPIDSAALTPSFSATQLAQQETPDPNELAHAVPGFAGYFLDNGQPTVYLTDTTQRPAAEVALAGWLSSRGF